MDEEIVELRDFLYHLPDIEMDDILYNYYNEITLGKTELCIVGLDFPIEIKIKPLNSKGFEWCGTSRNRTRDTRIFSPLLYQLS